MNFLELTQQRFSVRSFSEKTVEKEKIKYLLEAARMAPSACNLQPWNYTVVTNKELMVKIHDCYKNEWFQNVNTCIIAFGNHNHSFKRASDNKDMCDIDLGIATEHILLAAAEKGLGVCWLCAFDIKKIKNIFDCPKGLEPYAILAVGYANDNVKEPEKKRKNFESMVTWIE